MKLNWEQSNEIANGKYVKYSYKMMKYKINEKWKLNYWSNNKDIDKINNKCNELCKQIGFVEKKEKEDIFK